MPKTQTERQAIRSEHPDTWIAVEQGDAIEGKIVDVTDAWSDQRRDPATNKPGSSYPLLTVMAEEANGYSDLPRELKVHGFGAILFNEIMRKQPNIGERIRILYQGVGEAKPGQNPPERYLLRAAASGDMAKRAYAAIGLPKGQAGKPAEQQSMTEQPEDDIPY